MHYTYPTLTTDDPVVEAQLEANLQLSTQWAETQWNEEFHLPHLATHEKYETLFTDLDDMVGRDLWIFAAKEHDSIEEANEAVTSIATHLMYIISKEKRDTLGLVSIATQLERRLPYIGETFEERLNLVSQWLAHWSLVGLYEYKVTNEGYPLLIPLIQVPEALQEDLAKRFKAPIPQLSASVGDLQADGTGLVIGCYHSGKSSKRKLALNQECRDYISQVSQIEYDFNWELIQKLEYHAPLLSEEGEILTEQEREDCRVGWYRFYCACELAVEQGRSTICFPSVLDSRDRIYSMLNDPIIRQCLMSPVSTGSLTPFEQQLLLG